MKRARLSGPQNRRKCHSSGIVLIGSTHLHIFLLILHSEVHRSRRQPPSYELSTWSIAIQFQFVPQRFKGLQYSYIEHQNTSRLRIMYRDLVGEPYRSSTDDVPQLLLVGRVWALSRVSLDKRVGGRFPCIPCSRCRPFYSNTDYGQGTYPSFRSTKATLMRMTSFDVILSVSKLNITYCYCHCSQCYRRW